MGTILLYYKYVTISSPGEILKWQRELCDGLQLKGRILIANEGINGTVAGSTQAIEMYKQEMRKHPLFVDVDFKESAGDCQSFPRMRIVVRDYIVNGGQAFGNADLSRTGIHLKPKQVHELLEKKPTSLVILDARNNYESRIGTFQGAITPDIENFRDLPAYLDEHAQEFKDKEVLMFCTGGVRCERATAYLKAKGIAKEVYQIDGGIHKYAQEFPNGFFKGKNYVFDGRGAMQVTDDVLTHCDLCSQSCDQYTNCINAMCNELFIACPQCFEQWQSACSVKCFELVQSGAVIVRKEPALLVHLDAFNKLP